MGILFWGGIFAIVYLAIGIVTAAILANSPYSEVGWLRIMLLWPLFLLFG